MQTYHIIGDIHGCFQEFVNLTKLLGFEWQKQIPIHPNGDQLVFVGDLTDRGKNSLAVIDVVYELVIKKKIAYYAPGNHCNKLYRYFIGRNIQIKHGLETTVAELEALSSKQYNHYKEKFIRLYEGSPLYHMLDQRKLIVCHAGIKEEMIGKTTNSVKTFVLYGDITGEVLPNGMPVRRDWAKEYKGESIIVYGHTPILEPRVINKTYNIDTGAVFGGHLTALSYPSLNLTSVKSSMPFLEEKFTHFE